MKLVLIESSNVQILHNTFSKYKPTKLYSLDVIISVGYRVKSLLQDETFSFNYLVMREYVCNFAETSRCYVQITLSFVVMLLFRVM